ncbi:MAG: polymer-forming cytoskeletal protein [Oligoflexia bacterium]|nr:polymer-forming cytoskeletal protein [Oligoflexia bacterium]
MVFWNNNSGKKPSPTRTESGTPVAGASSTEASVSQPAPQVISPSPAILGANEAVKPSAPQVAAPDPSKIRCALGMGTMVNGKLSFDTSVQIDGKMKGELFTSKTLVVGKTGLIEATVDAACLIVSGTMRGKIRVTEKLELKAGAVVEGEVYAPCVLMEDGATLNAAVTMGLGSGRGEALLPHAAISEKKPNSDKGTSSRPTESGPRASVPAESSVVMQ